MSSRPNRREFLALCAAAGVWSVAGCQTSRGRLSQRSAADEGPIDWMPSSDLSGFGGDSPERAHSSIRDRNFDLQAFANVPLEDRRLVILGGGVSGLFSAYVLREHRPLILEAGARFGGNSRGEAIGDAVAPLGAAYCIRPETGSALDDIFRELRLYDQLVIKSESDPVVADGRWVTNFWAGGSDSSSKASFVAFYEFLKSVYEQKGGHRYPEMPSRDRGMRTYLSELDQFSLRAYLERHGIFPLHSQVHAYVEQYCWTALGGSASEVSAAAGLSFLAEEIGPIAFGHGGNATIVEAIYRKLIDELPDHSLRANSPAVRVETESSYSTVYYYGPGGQPHRVRARAVVMACPKFIAKRVVSDLPPERRSAMDALEYRPYVVANVDLDRRIPKDALDVYFVSDRNVQRSASLSELRATDVLVNRSLGQRSGSSEVLSLYCPLPTGSRAHLLMPTAEAEIRAALGHQLRSEILPAFGLKDAVVETMRLVRWGHPLPLARQGLYTGDTIERLSEPHRERVFFVSQDNWALPALETGALEALHWAPQIRRVLET